MPYKDFSIIEGTLIPEPFKRELKIIMSPDRDEDVRDFTLLISTLAPHGGCTDFHAHEKEGELMIFTSGHGRAWLGNEEHELKPGVAIYAPPGVKHKTENTGSEPLQIACIFIPAVSAEYIMENINAAKKAHQQN